MILLLIACADEGTCTPDGPTERPAEELLINGTCVEEGSVFTEVYDCSEVEGPCTSGEPSPAIAKVDEDPARLDDEDLEWTRDQMGACSCSCCHHVEGVSGFWWAWDFEPAWTDSIDSEALAGFINEEPDHFYDDLLTEENNHGFTRDFGAPTTDHERFGAFVERELDRRGVE